jgi:fumarate hydratase subunit beta
MAEATRIECRPLMAIEQKHGVRAGDLVEISGQLTTIRDATARRLYDLAASGSPLPVDFAGKLLYAVGPSPAKPGRVIGSAGPTTIERFTKFLPLLFEAGIAGVVGKGELHGPIVDVFRAAGGLYFAAVGGLGALLGKCVTAAEVVAFPELGPEAIFTLDVERFPAVTIIDTIGGNYHETARYAWRNVDADPRQH